MRNPGAREATCRSFPARGCLAVAATAYAGVAFGASAAPHGDPVSLAWGAPFAGLILSIAILPLLAPSLWHHHFGKIALAWTLTFLVPAFVTQGADTVLHLVSYALVGEYLPFITVLFALFTIAGGINMRGGLRGTPQHNTILLAIGASLASAVGTTGAAMLLVRPLLAANAHRTRVAHIVVFFIILVGNVGGALSPLGDPPLFIGFLKGVDFFWTTRHLLLPTLFVVAVLLTLFYTVDRYILRQESARIEATPEPFTMEGKHNLILLVIVVASVLMTALWQPGVAIDIAGTPVELQRIASVIILWMSALASILITPRKTRERNAFTWFPIAEVAKLFAAIFVAIIPVIEMLREGRDGALGAVIVLAVDASTGAPRDAVVYWLTGLMSAFLDNAPTYLVFFTLAGGDADLLMGAMKSTLASISAAAVYFGALTYIGNAPNFMVKSIAESQGVKMPDFFGYIGYAGMIMLPLLAIVPFLLRNL